MSSDLFRKLGIFLALILMLWLGSRFLLPIALPFLLALLLCLAAEPLVRLLQKRLHLGRTPAAGIGITVTLILAILALVSLCALAIRQLGALAGVVPDLGDTAVRGMDSLEGFCLNLAGRTPQSIRPLLTQGVENIFSDGSQILDRILTALLNLATDIVKALPDSALGIGTWVLASYMLCARLPRIRGWLSRFPGFRERYLPALKQVKHTLGGWILAQAKLMGITFLVLTAGFVLLQIRYAPLWAVLIALVDALPILGTGMVLIPWALVCFLQGSHIRAMGLLATYAVAALLRSVLEPRLIGKQLGLDPLITLIALYAGYRIWGFGGMIVAPLLTVTATQFAHATQADS